MIILTPAVFGWEHLTYTSIALMLIVIGAVLCRLFLKEERSRSIAVRITGAILLALILWNRICIMNDAIDAGGTALSIIPNTFCGLASLTTALALLVVKKDSNLLHFILYLGLLGGFFDADLSGFRLSGRKFLLSEYDFGTPSPYGFILGGDPLHRHGLYHSEYGKVSVLSAGIDGLLGDRII